MLFSIVHHFCPSVFHHFSIICPYVPSPFSEWLVAQRFLPRHRLPPARPPAAWRARWRAAELKRAARPREAVRSEKWQGRHMNTPIDIYGYLWIFNYI